MIIRTSPPSAPTGPRWPRRPNSHSSEKAAEHGVALVTKEGLFRTADIVSVHLILSDRSRGLIGKSEIDQMKSSALLVNTSRGPIVAESALIEALRDKRIGGAAVDVFDREPLSAEHPFRSLPNVLATPHIGYVADDLSTGRSTKTPYRTSFRGWRSKAEPIRNRATEPLRRATPKEVEAKR
jgi:phosphoglycerate dehydrogenase-like enzyme